MAPETISGTVEESAIEDLRSRLAGEVFTPANEGYDDARTVWNGVIDRSPALVVRAQSTADVVEAVHFARDHRLVVTARGGGHGVAGSALTDGGLVVDLSAMRSVHVDPAARTARAKGGATLGDVDTATQMHGLATPLGAVSKTGIAGLTLSGGIGWLRRKHGLAADNLVSLEVVTADGRVRTASESENPELFWALCGGGGGFGVVTSFEYRLHPLGPEVMVAFVLYPGERAVEVLRSVDEYTAHAPYDVAPLAFLGHVPHADAFPAEAHGLPYVAVAALYAGDVTHAEEALAPLRALGDPIVDLSGRMPYTEAQRLLDEDYPDGWRYYWKSVDLDELEDAVLERVAAHAATAPSHHSTVDVWYHGGAMSRVDPAATAFGRRPSYLIGVEANWEESESDDENIAWARATVSDLERFSAGGAYLNFPGFFEEGQEQLRESYGAANYARLVELKRELDPDHVFAGAGTIRPSATLT